MKAEKSLIKRLIPLLIALAVFVAAAAIAVPVLAYYIRSTGEVVGNYEPAEPTDPSFDLNINHSEVSSIAIEVKDEGYPVYVRVAIVVTWERTGAECDCGNGCTCSGCANSDLCAKCNPEVFFAVLESDYSYTVNTASWVDNTKKDGFYYVTKPLESNSPAPDGKVLQPLKTEALFKSFKLVASGPAEYPDGTTWALKVKVIVQTIQAIGNTDSNGEIPAWQDAWGIDAPYKP